MEGVEGQQRFYCPLSFWFAETRSRALDLSILHSSITIDMVFAIVVDTIWGVWVRDCVLIETSLTNC